MEIDGVKRLVRFGGVWNQRRQYVSMKSCNEYGAVDFSLDELLARLLKNALLEV